MTERTPAEKKAARLSRAAAAIRAVLIGDVDDWSGYHLGELRIAAERLESAADRALAKKPGKKPGKKP